MVIQNWVHHPVSQLLNSLPLQSGPTKQAVIVPRLDHEEERTRTRTGVRRVEVR